MHRQIIMKVICKFFSVDAMRKGGKRMGRQTDRQTDDICYCLLLFSC